MTGRAFLEAKAATQEDNNGRSPVRVHPVGPGANPDWPIANNYRYQDRNNNLIYNALASPTGGGYANTNREQGNASLSVFRGRNELKFGADYQDMTAANLNVIGQQFFGRVFDSTLPGGFVTPSSSGCSIHRERSRTPATCCRPTPRTASTWGSAGTCTPACGSTAVVRQRRRPGGELVDRRRAAAGRDLRRRGQRHDAGQGHAGRYYQVTGLDIFSREYATKPNGTNLFTQYRWNAATRSYDIFQQRSVPVLGKDPGDFDPYYKDELSLGFEWQFVPAWVFQSRYIRWDISDTFWSTDQFDATGRW